MPARLVWLAGAAVFAITFAMYLRTLHPGVPGPDSGELITVARVLGIAHPPGYPLYTLLAHAFGLVVPWGSYAARLNLMSALLQAGTAALLCVTVCRLTRSAGAGIAAALALGCSRPFWRAALVAEVFPLNDLMAAALWLSFAVLLRDAGLLGVRPPNGRATSPWPLAVLITVTAAIPAHHHTLAILALPLAAVALALAALPERRLLRALPRYRRPYALGRNHVMAGAACLALGLAPLAYLPWAAGRVTPVTWGEADRPAGFLALLARAEYGSGSLAPMPGSPGADVHHAWLYLQNLPGDFAWVGAVLALLGGLVLVRAAVRGNATGAWGAGARPLLAVILGSAILQTAFFSRVPFPSGTAYFRGVVERFYVLPDLTVALLAGLGGAACLGAVAGRLRPAAAGLLVLLAGVSPHVAHMRTLDQRGNHAIEDLGRNVLASLPRDAVLFSIGDIFYNSLLYLTVVEGQRPDVVFADQFLMTRAWYVRELRRRHPDLLPVFTTYASPDSDYYKGDSLSGNRRWIEHLQGRRPVAFTGFIDHTYESRYEMVRTGYTLVPHLRGQVPPAGDRARAAARLLGSLTLDGYFRPQDPRGPEAEGRLRTTQLLAGVCFLLCDSEGQALRRAEYPGLATLATFLERYTRTNPVADPELLRAAGFLYVYHPEFRNRSRAEQALGHYLAVAPAGPEADGASQLLEAIRRGQ
jgi:hypothetical protein